MRESTRAGRAVVAVLSAGIGLAVGAPRTAVPAAAADAPTPTPVPVITVPMAANAIVYEPHQDVLFASVGANSPQHANSVVPIDPATGAIGAPVLSGPEPNAMAVSDDGAYLYVGVDGDHAIARIDLVTGAEDQRWPLGRVDPPPGHPAGSGDEMIAGDIAVMPGRPTIVVVSGRGDYESPGGVIVFDDGIALPDRVPRVVASDDPPYSVEFSDVIPGRLYGTNGASLFRMDIGASGVTVLDRRDVANFYNGGLHVAGGHLYDGKYVVDAEVGAVVAAAETGGSSNATPAEVDSAVGEFYVLVDVNEVTEVRAFSSTTALAVESYSARLGRGVSALWGKAELMGTRRLAVATRGSIDPAAVHLLDLGARRGAAGEYAPLTPSRIVDTRAGLGVTAAAPLGPGASFDVQVTGRGGVPSDGVSAVVVNATAVDATEASYLTVWPGGTARPEISSLNFGPGVTRANLVTVEVGSSGALALFNERGQVDLVLDVVGYYATADGLPGSRFRSMSPRRAFDTRGGTPLGSDASMSFRIAGVPVTNVTAVALNVTAVEPTGAGYITVWPGDVERPTASSINFAAGETVPNLVIVRVPASGVVSFYNFGGTTHLIADVAGYYTADRSGEGGRFVQLGPKRLFDTRGYTTVTSQTQGIKPGWTVNARNALRDAGYGTYVLNVTVTDTRDAGYVTVHPAPGEAPLASNLNYGPHTTVPNAVIVASGTATFSLANEGGTTQLIVDLFGAFTGY
jgi:hypothetical protein